MARNVTGWSRECVLRADGTWLADGARVGECVDFCRTAERGWTACGLLTQIVAKVHAQLSFALRSPAGP
eukprot:6663427-Prymnesium_polylepis.1